MIAEAIRCGVCSWALPPAQWNDDGGFCPGCGTLVIARVFPAIAQTKAAGAPESLAAESEASCFYHLQNRAVTHCDQCGRFLCGLCELPIPGSTLCPVCFEANTRGRKMEQLETGRTMHDNIALALAVIPGTMIWPALIGAPFALYWTIRHWNSPRSLAPRTRIRFYLAALISVAQIGFFIFLGVIVAMAWRRR